MGEREIQKENIPLKKLPCSRKGDQINYFFILKDASTAL
jgi:hypothetical protein